MKTEEILHYDRMYQAMRQVLDADIIAFGFWNPNANPLTSRLREHGTSDPEGSPPCAHLSGAKSL
ncbi:MAG: hypothetical protein WBZ24_07940 [Anaerolineales bacterium]